MYLKFLVHLLHHVNFNVTAAVYLTHVAGKDLSNTQVSIVSDIKFDPAVFQKLLLGGALSQHNWPPRLNKAGSGDLDISILRIIHPDRARNFWVFRAINGSLAGGSAVGVGVS